MFYKHKGTSGTYRISECGTCVFTYLDQPKSVEKDIEYWERVKTWVKKYYQESF